METPLQVTYRAIEHSDALDQRIRERAARLESLHDRIGSCRVVVEQVDRHKRHGRQYSVRIDLRVPPHREIALTREHDEDVFVALRDAFDAAELGLKELHRKLKEQRHET